MPTLAYPAPRRGPGPSALRQRPGSVAPQSFRGSARRSECRGAPSRRPSVAMATSSPARMAAIPSSTRYAALAIGSADFTRSNTGRRSALRPGTRSPSGPPSAHDRGTSRFWRSPSRWWPAAPGPARGIDSANPFMPPAAQFHASSARLPPTRAALRPRPASTPLPRPRYRRRALPGSWPGPTPQSRRVVRRCRLTPRNRSDSKCYHADRHPICALNNSLTVVPLQIALAPGLDVLVGHRGVLPAGVRIRAGDALPGHPAAGPLPATLSLSAERSARMETAAGRQRGTR